MNTLIRKYTPPTCTLEIWGIISPLSIWTGKNILTDARFELRLDDPRISEDQQVTLKGDRTQLQLLCEVVFSYVQNLLSLNADALPLTLVTTSPQATLPSLPSLQPQGFLNHELFLGALVADTHKSTIALTTSQLFDLANALEDYTRETDLIPRLARKKSRKSALIWTSVAASTILAIGGTVIGVKLYQQSQQVATIPTPTPSPKSTQTLPSVPLPPTGITPPSPNLPVTLGNKTPLPTPSGIGTVTAPGRSSSVPLVVPPQPYLPPPPTVSSAPNSTAIIIEPRTSKESISAPPAPKNGGTNAVEKLSPTVINPNPTAPKLPKLPPINADTRERVNGRASERRDNVPLSETTINSQKTPPLTTNLLDTIPQVTETREYFKARWKPPESLKQTLEYRLVLNQNGSLKQIIPLGQSAKIYLDRTSMPLLNEPFVSPLDIVGNPQLRLVLSPDGTVRTFMEQE